MTGPQYNAILSSRYSEALNRQLGEDVRVDTVAPELAPVLVVENDRPEWSFLRSEYLWATALQQLLDVANNSAVQLRNQGQNTLLTIEEVVISTSVATELNIALVSVINLPTQAFGRPRDSRQDTNVPGIFQQSVGIISRANNVGIPTPTSEQVFIPANTPYRMVTTPYVLGFGFVLRIVTTAINCTLDVSFKWRERGQQPGEV